MEGAGPGMLIAAEVIKALFKSDIHCFSGLMTPAGKNWKQFFLRLEHANARVLVVLLSKAFFFQSIACLKEVHAAIEKGLEIIPVRVEESESRAIDIARDTESMLPDETIQNYARSDSRNDTLYQKKLQDTQVQRYAVKEALGNLNTFPPRGSLFGYHTGLQDLVSRVEGIVYANKKRRIAD